MADFPHDQLGFPLIRGYGFSAAAAHDRIEPIRGAAVFRFRQRTPPERASLEFLLDESQLQYWRWWVHVDADRMNAWFTMRLRVGELPASANPLGAELVEREVHFDGAYDVAHAGDFDGYRVTATVEMKYAAPSVPP